MDNKWIVLLVMFFGVGCGKKLTLMSNSSNITECKKDLTAQLVRLEPKGDIIFIGSDVVWSIDNVYGACGSKLLAIFENENKDEKPISINLKENKSITIRYSNQSNSKTQKVLILDISDSEDIIQNISLESSPFTVTNANINGNIPTNEASSPITQVVNENPINNELIIVFGVVEPLIDNKIYPFNSTIKIAWHATQVTICIIKEDDQLKDWTLNGGTTTSGFHIIENVKSNHKYDILCSTISGQIISSSFELKVEPPPKPNAPTSLNARAIDSSTIKVEWRDNSQDETGFIIGYKEDGKTDVTYLTVESNITSYNLINLKENTKYFINVCAEGIYGNSPPADWVFATTPASPKWFSVLNVNCEDYCQNIGKTNISSPDGHKCASGELIPSSSIGFLNFPYGCWPNCSAHGAANGKSIKHGRKWRCYGDNQKRDIDNTDIVVGCYCK